MESYQAQGKLDRGRPNLNMFFRFRVIILAIFLAKSPAYPPPGFAALWARVSATSPTANILEIAGLVVVAWA